MVGALMYLTASRPDIVHATCYCARYQAKPTEKHLTAVKRIFRYLKDSINMGLGIQRHQFELMLFSEFGHAGLSRFTLRAHLWHTILGGDKLCQLVSKSRTPSMSLAKLEYVSYLQCAHKFLWLRISLTNYGFHFDKIPMYCDSKAAIAISCNPVQLLATKHIDVQISLIKEHCGSLLQPPITKTKSAQIESRARRDHSINLIRTQCQNTLGGHHKVHRSRFGWQPCQGDSLNLPDHRAQVDQGSQIKMIQVKEMMQDNDLKNSKSKDKGSKSRSQSMDEQSHYKQDKTITRQSINVKRHIFNVIGGTEEFEERDLNIGGDC
ncbi:hypothetical protein Tco_0885498 [Tanacetum coccineum]